MRTAYVEAMKAKAHRQMKIDDGATAPGEDPPVSYLRALDEAPDSDAVEQVRAAHADGRGPPDWAGASGKAGGPPGRGN
jgi:hypothetical protein